MIKFWAEVEVPDDGVQATEDPTLFDVRVSSLLFVEDEMVRFKVLRFVTDEPREEESK